MNIKLVLVPKTHFTVKCENGESLGEFVCYSEWNRMLALRAKDGAQMIVESPMIDDIDGPTKVNLIRAAPCFLREIEKNSPRPNGSSTIDWIRCIIDGAHAFAGDVFDEGMKQKAIGWLDDVESKLGEDFE